MKDTTVSYVKSYPSWRPILGLTAGLLFAFHTGVLPSLANAQDAVANADTALQQPGHDKEIEQGKESEFAYELEDRKDPFIPFITQKAATSSVNMDEIVDSVGELTGMQLFEPGQLNLVALLQKDAKQMAMVEDVSGKGYIITIGTKIGRRGVVKDIIPNKVLIEETAFTRAGKKIVTQTVMVLKKEGEE